VAFDTNTLFVDSTENRVGVGTIAPTRKLHVSGDGQTATGGVIHSTLTDPSGAPYESNAFSMNMGGYGHSIRMELNMLSLNAYGDAGRYGKMKFVVGDNASSGSGQITAMTLLPGGNVGIGTTSPGAKFTLYGDDTQDEGGLLMKVVDRLALPGGFTGIGLGGYATTSAPIIQVAKSAIIHERTGYNGTGNLMFCNDDTTDNNDVSNTHARMTITGAGNVGIGTTTPARPLEIAGGGGTAIINLKRTDIGPGQGGLAFLNNLSNVVASVTASRSGTEGGELIFRTVPDDTTQTSDNPYLIPECMRIDKDGNVGIGTTSPETKLDIRGRVHQEDGRYKFDFENRRPDRLTPTTEFRSVVVEGFTTARYIVPDSGTTVYQYNPGTDVTSTLIATTSSNDATGTVTVVAGTEIYSTGSFNIIVPSENHAVVPFRCKGYYFGYSNNRYVPTSIFLYAPYENVTVNVYLDKAITETPTQTLTLTKQSVTELTVNPSSAYFSYTIEAVNGVILAARSGYSNGTLNGDNEILYPASDLGYNMVSSSATYYNHDVFSTGGADTQGRRFASDIINNGVTFYSPSGIPHFSSVGGDGDGGDTTGIIPHELLGEIYYIPHTIPGYMIGCTTNRQTVTVQYYHAGAWVTSGGTTTSLSRRVSAYNMIPYRYYTVGGQLDVGRSAFTADPAASALWKFTSDHPFALRVESAETASDWDEYMAVGWLNPTRTTPIYKPPCPRGPMMYITNIQSGLAIDVNAGVDGTWTSYAVFTTDSSSQFNNIYGNGFIPNAAQTAIIVPSPGMYRATANIGIYREDTNADRTSTEVTFSKYGSVTQAGDISEGYIRQYDGHDSTTLHVTSIIDIARADWNPSSTEYLPEIGLLFRRNGTTTSPVYIGPATITLERIE
jgi:hypothetical protein